MKVAGIIAEYNPLHSGHLYHLLQTKKTTAADYTIIVMSGDYVQRGEPAIFNKYLRTATALQAGADVVLELPPLLATASAAEFAAGAVALLDQLGVVTHLSFGSEAGAISSLQQTAAFLCDETEDYQQLFQSYLKQGYHYPKARALTLEQRSATNSFQNSLQQSNDILGVEYLLALQRQKSTIQPVTIKRMGHGYHDLAVDDQFISATAIRKWIQNQKDPLALTDKIPAATVNLLQNHPPLFLDDFSVLLNHRLLLMNTSQEAYEAYLDVSPELADRIRKNVLSLTSYQDRIFQLKSKNYTYTRISRALLHLLLGIKKADLSMAKQNHYLPYARILGFNQTATPLLKALKANSSIPLISKVANARRLLPASAYPLFEQALLHSHIYQSVYYSKYGQVLKNEYTHGCIKY